MARMKGVFDFKEFENLADRLREVGGDVKKTTEKCLKESHKIITDKLEKDIKKHKYTGRTEDSIRKEADVEWSGSVAEVKVGFQFPEGLASVFLMYGTPRKKKDGTPMFDKDRKLYNDIYGKKTKKEISESNNKIVAEAVRKAMGG